MFDEADIALNEIEKVDIPTLLLFGEEDKIVNIEEYKKIKNSNISKISFYKGKHELFECIYNKNKFYDKIFEFLK
jgi:esterase/lipase